VAWNYRVLVGQGVAYSAARRLASPRLVLPFLYVALGAPIALAGVLVPLVQLSQLAAQVIAAPWLRRRGSERLAMAMTEGLAGVALGALGLAAGLSSGALIALLFLVGAAVIGSTQGVNSLAFQQVLGRALPARQRGQMLFTQTALSGLVTLALAAGTTWALRSRTPLQSHLGLLWAGALVTISSGLVAMMLHEARGDEERPATAEPHPGLRGLAADLRRMWALVWFRRFLVARCLLESVELGMPFYAIHAATLHAHEQGSLNGFVIASGLGTIVGGPVWRALQARSMRVVLVAGSLVAVAAGALALLVDADPALHEGWLLHSGVFLLVAMAAQGVSSARVVYLTELAPPEELGSFLAISNLIVGLVGLAVALALGALAQLQHVLWPLVVLMGVNVLSALAAARLPRDSADLSVPHGGA
jgi:hypothetical protein